MTYYSHYIFTSKGNVGSLKLAYANDKYTRQQWEETQVMWGISQGSGILTAAAYLQSPPLARVVNLVTTGTATRPGAGFRQLAVTGFVKQVLVYRKPYTYIWNLYWGNMIYCIRYDIVVELNKLAYQAMCGKRVYSQAN